jgi:hypothetical protein
LGKRPVVFAGAEKSGSQNVEMCVADAEEHVLAITQPCAFQPPGMISTPT